MGYEGTPECDLLNRPMIFRFISVSLGRIRSFRRNYFVRLFYELNRETNDFTNGGLCPWKLGEDLYQNWGNFVVGPYEGSSRF